MKEIPNKGSLSDINICPINENQLELTMSSEQSNQGKNGLFQSFNINKVQRQSESKKALKGYKKNKTNKIGNTYTFINYKGNYLITVGPQYYLSFMLCMIITTAFITAQVFLYKHLHFIFRIFHIFTFMFQIATHGYTTLINPGIPSQKYFLSDNIISLISKNPTYNQRFNLEKYQVCKICNLLLDKETNAIHCADCNICCMNYHHHCPWVGKCIGKNTIRTFKLFIFSTFFFFIYLFFSVILILIQKG